MFRKNKTHLQPSLISNVHQLPEKQRQRLEQSWAGVFYREVFSRIDETPFGVLYADIPSRPNVAVNVLVGLEFLKSGMGWSDEELYDAFLYNVQVRYALGYDALGEGEFELRTLYYFRERLNRHMQSKGENLLAKAFEQVTDEQITAFKLKTGIQRMDTTQVASNIREWDRLQLLVVVLQRAYRMLSESDQVVYAERFGPYVKESAGHYTYRLKKGDFFPHLQKIGDCMHQLLLELKGSYHDQPVFQMLERVFNEHYRVEAQGVKGLLDNELNPHRLLSPDDFEATLRGRRHAIYQGYVTNLTETCDPANPVQLITKVQVDSNNVDDPKLLLAALPGLKQRTGLKTLYTDGGFGSPDVDLAMIGHQIEQIPSGIRGQRPNPDTLSLVDFEIQMVGANPPTQIQCPHGQSVKVELTRSKLGCAARFDLSICSQCPFGQHEQCPAEPGRKNPICYLYFTINDALLAKRRKRVRAVSKEKHNLRAAIEATCRAIKCRFPKGKFPVRGLFRMTCMVIGSAALNNVRQINRYLLST
ncbi:MAG TPA: hypothetical protein VIK21_00775 [Desulfuromonadaceae bacterium]